MRRRARPGGGRQLEVVIEGVGARGDGYATLDGALVYVPFTQKGDRVRIRVTGARAGGAKGEVIELLAEGPGRAEPPCPHYGPCGGCALQHLETGAYAAWKASLLPQALAHRGFKDVRIAPMVQVAPGTRRRAVLAALRRGGRVLLGFHQRQGRAVVDLTTCLLLTPRLDALLPALRQVLVEVLPDSPREATVTVTDTGEGADVLIAAPGQPGLGAREALTRFAETADLARLSWRQEESGEAAIAAEPVVVRRPPRLQFGAVSVEPAPGAFLQPSAAGQAALSEAILGYLPETCERIADLFCGSGAFTFPLSARTRVLAVDGAEEAVAALWTATRRADLAGRIAVEVRDLARAPLLAGELTGFDAVVFDPPRAGAREQALELAESGVATVIAVSCNPKTFARDARILADGGYSLMEVTPVDQFPWSGHLELVAKFAR